MRRPLVSVCTGAFLLQAAASLSGLALVPLASRAGAAALASDPAASATGAADGSWLRISYAPGRSSHTTVHDAAGDRLIVFGGSSGGRHGDLWALDLSGAPAWKELTPAFSPAARSGHAAILDPARRGMLVFGGFGGSLLNDVWRLDLEGTPAWTELAPAGPLPAPRNGHTAIHDPVGDRVLVFGGFGGTSRLGDLWELSLSGAPGWSPMTPQGTGPGARNGHTAVYDPAERRMLVFGGFDTGPLNDVWQLTLDGAPAWSRVTTSGGPPAGRLFHSAILDPLRDRMLIFAGYDGSDDLDDVWELSLGPNPTWSQVAPGGTAPLARRGQSALYDPFRDRMLVFGGRQQVYFPATFENRVFALELAGEPEWSEPVPAETLPLGRWGHTAVRDAVSDRMIVFGGSVFVTGKTDETWALSLADPQVWKLLDPGGPPPARFEHAAIFDPVRERMLVFGGLDGSAPLGDVWELTLAGAPMWERLFPSGLPPPARYGHSAIYDPVRDRMLVFGGLDGAAALNDVWELSLAGEGAWTQVAVSGAPPPARFWHGAIYDPQGDRMIVFAGGQLGGVRLDDLWELALGAAPTWTELSPPGPTPDIGHLHSAIHDPVRGRMVTFGGYRYDGDHHYLDEVWSLSLTGAPEWTRLNPALGPPRGRDAHSAIYDPPRDRMIVFGGTGEFTSNDTWELAWGSTVDAPASAARAGPALSQSRPNPARGPLAIDFVLPRGGATRLEVFDLAGRSLRTLVSGTLGPGAHTARWDLSTGRGRVAKPGVYFYALTGPGLRSVRRLVILE